MTTSSLPRDQKLFNAMIVCGAAALAIGMPMAFDRVWPNLLIVAFYLLTLALGGAVFVAVGYVTGAGWSVAFRRIPEAMARLLPWAGMLMLLVLGLKMNSYGWHHAGEGGAGTFWFKELWLTPAFWMGRSIAYVAIWSLLALRLVNRSARSDGRSAEAVNERNSRQASRFLLIFALTFTLASFDWVMALDPMWFSTIFAVYHFAGMFLTVLATCALLGIALRQPGLPLAGIVRDEHLHDMGKLILGFSCFWMYIWFSQYMLIWYSNLPEETSYFVVRIQSSWGPLVVASILLNWVIPFLVLLPRPAKRNPNVLIKVAGVVLIGRWVDLYVMVLPSELVGRAFGVFDLAASHGAAVPAEAVASSAAAVGPAFGLFELASLCLLIGLVGKLFQRAFYSMDPVASHDGFLNESMHYAN